MNFGNTDSMGVAFIVTKYMIPLSFSIFLLVLSYNAFDSGFSRPKIFVSFNEFLHISNHVNVRAFLIYLLPAKIFTQPSIRAKHVSILNMTIIQQAKLTRVAELVKMLYVYSQDVFASQKRNAVYEATFSMYDVKAANILLLNGMVCID